VPAFLSVYSDIVGLFGHIARGGRCFCLAGDADLGVSTLERRGVFRLPHADAGQLGHQAGLGRDPAGTGLRRDPAGSCPLMVLELISP
jgi:hypothetical protein